MEFPPLEVLNAMPADEMERALAPLVEGAPGLLPALAAERPFGSDAALLDAARELAHRLPEADRIALLNAHPRIGAAAADLSELSSSEQPEVPDEPAWIGEELAALNAIYEARFGFRFVIFVAGRPREAVIPLLEAAIHGEREAELRRGVDDAIYIAGDRLTRLRGAAG